MSVLEEKIKELIEENQGLKRLCDIYEEEHNTTFIKWQKDIKKKEETIKELKEVNKWLKNYDFGDNYYPDLTQLINKLEK